jgi:putative ATPase
VIAGARKEKSASGRKTLLLIDEIHRFNKVQQSALLPDVEKGNITLVGASTQNPFFSIIPALASRSQIVEMKPLPPEALRSLLQRAMTDPERGFGAMKIVLTEEAEEHLLATTEGDARRLLNAFEIGVTTTPPDSEGGITFDLSVAEESVQKKGLVYENEESHYNTISAFIKSVRGSDPDAAVYWLAKMIYAGEDPLFIARRMIILASEDIGNADPRALGVAVSALHALEAIGMPEGRIPLAQAVAYLATAPKSNAAYLAVESALEEISTGRVMDVPADLQDAHYAGAKKLGRGKGYLYPHDYPGHFVPQAYLPEEKVFYRPSDQGEEKKISERLEGWREKKRSAGKTIRKT